MIIYISIGFGLVAAALLITWYIIGAHLRVSRNATKYLALRVEGQSEEIATAAAANKSLWKQLLSMQKDVETLQLNQQQLAKQEEPKRVRNEKPAAERVQDFFGKHGAGRRVEIMKAAKISKTHVGKILKELIDKGAIERTAEGKYQLKTQTEE